MKNKKIVIAGGTGFIGQALAAWFGKENAVVILTRHQPGPSSATLSQTGREKNNAFGQQLLSPHEGIAVSYRHWDGLRVEKSWASAIDGADIVINLSGKSVNCRYTPKNRQEIFDSRTDSTRAIGLAIRDAVTPPKLWINAASTTIYRHAEDRPQDEFTGEFEDDFSVQVCRLWEKTFDDQRTPFTRKVALRMAVTLGEGGVITPYLYLLKFALGGHQGSGRQMYSWLHIEDLCRSIDWISDHEELEGVFNVCSPHPVTNHAFMKTLRQVTGHRIGLPAYTWMLKIGAALIGTEPELLLKSRWVLPTRLLQTGFEFRYPELSNALIDLFKKIPRKKYHLF